MYKHIMVPVDLRAADKLNKALRTAADLARHYGATVHYVGVTGAAPSEVAPNPAGFAERLREFAAQQSAEHGIQAQSKPMLSHDQTIDLDSTLSKAGEEIGADLIVMGSHVPGMLEHVFSSNAGYLASHSSLSVFVVR